MMPSMAFRDSSHTASLGRAPRAPHARPRERVVGRAGERRGAGRGSVRGAGKGGGAQALKHT